MRKNNAKNNAKQRRRGTRPGGVTGKGFLPGKSGNPKGRPPIKGLLLALRAAVTGTLEDGRTIEQAIVDQMIHEALRGRRKLQAIAEIFDRLEGKPRQVLDLNDITKQLQGRTDAELLYYAERGTWPAKVGNA